MIERLGIDNRLVEGNKDKEQMKVWQEALYATKANRGRGLGTTTTSTTNMTKFMRQWFGP